MIMLIRGNPKQMLSIIMAIPSDKNSKDDEIFLKILIHIYFLISIFIFNNYSTLNIL